jgi:YkoY family integral membrane protein
MFGQTFDPQDLATVLLLVVLEGVLSIDNALVLALLAKRVPKQLQARALTYGLVGAFVFRFIAIGTAAYLLRWRIVKLLGGGYLVWVALKHLLAGIKDQEHLTVGPDQQPTVVDETTGREISPADQEQKLRARTTLPIESAKHAGFWSTVAMIELTDIAFAVDSILAAIAVVGSAPAGHQGPHPKFWVVLTGGLLIRDVGLSACCRDRNQVACRLVAEHAGASAHGRLPQSVVAGILDLLGRDGSLHRVRLHAEKRPRPADACTARTLISSTAEAADVVIHGGTMGFTRSPDSTANSLEEFSRREK